MYRDVLKFWFEEIRPEQWFRKDLAFDHALSRRFGELHQRAARCELYAWRAEPEGRLAEIIVLDQFSRNIFRDMPGAFASDAMALTLAQEAVAAGADRALEPVARRFLYMPYMHSESSEIHKVAEQLFRDLGDPDVLHYELLHKAIVDRFGRYPHRNDILGRASTPEEKEFLTQPNSSF